MDQDRVVGLQVFLHSVHGCRLRSSHLSQFFRHLVIEERFAKLCNMNVLAIGFPELPFC